MAVYLLLKEPLLPETPPPYVEQLEECYLLSKEAKFLGPYMQIRARGITVVVPNDAKIITQAIRAILGDDQKSLKITERVAL